MRIIFAIIAMASLGHAQTLRAMSDPLPWRMAHQYATVENAGSTWTGSEGQEISRLVDAIDRGSREVLGLNVALMKSDAARKLAEARQHGLSSVQAREIIAQGLWRSVCACWANASAAAGDRIDGEDLVSMAQQIGVPAAQKWGQAKREFALAIERWHEEK